MIESRNNLANVLSRYLPSLQSTAMSVLVILLIALTWRLLTFAGPEPVGHDESVYRFYAQTLGERGWDGLRSVVHEWPDNPGLNKGPLPYRLFFIVPAMWACRLLGGYTVAHIALLSSLFSIGFIVVTLVLARRWFGPVYGFFIALLMVFSPLAAGLARRGLQDTCFAFVAASSVLLYDRCWKHRRRSDVWLLGIALLAGFLTKESMAFLYPSFFLAGLYYARKGWRGKVHIAVPFAFAPLIHVAIVSWLSGGLSEALDTYQSYSIMQRQIPYALKYQSGPWFRYLVDMILLSPLAVLLAIVGASSSWTDRDTAMGRHLSLIYLLSGLAVFSLLPLLNVRIVLFLEFYVLVFALVGILDLSKRISPNPRLQFAAFGLLIVLLIANEIVQFNTIFSTSGIYDPITLNLVHATGFVR